MRNEEASNPPKFHLQGKVFKLFIFLPVACARGAAPPASPAHPCTSPSGCRSGSGDWPGHGCCCSVGVGPGWCCWAGFAGTPSRRATSACPHATGTSWPREGPVPPPTPWHRGGLAAGAGSGALGAEGCRSRSAGWLWAGWMPTPAQ